MCHVSSTIDAYNSLLDNVQKWLKNQNFISNIQKTECMFSCNEKLFMLRSRVDLDGLKLVYYQNFYSILFCVVIFGVVLLIWKKIQYKKSTKNHFTLGLQRIVKRLIRKK